MLRGPSRSLRLPIRLRLVAAAAGLLAFCASGAANETDIYLPVNGFARPSGSEANAGPARTAGPESPAPSTSAAHGASLTSPTARFSLIELPAERSPLGTARRPHHAIGYRWQGAESWLREHGVDAQTCYLPMVRLHTKVSSSANLSGTLWVYGRCTFR